MNNRWAKTAASCLMVLALAATLCISCAGEGEEGKVTIIIGNITDITGPAGPATLQVTWGLEDAAKYVNQEKPIPGVELKVITYDCRYDPSRDIPGFEWCKERGAKVIYSPMPTTTMTLKRLAESDRIPIITATAAEAALEPPGWVFAWFPPAASIGKGLVDWIGEQWTGAEKVKIGSAGWEEPYHADVTRGIREYCRAHPDKFDYVGGFLTPMGTMTWGGEIDKLKECDYICVPSTGMATATFIDEARAKGYAGKLFATDAITGFMDLILAKVGWEAIDGLLISFEQLWWSDSAASMDLTKEYLYEFHSNEAEDSIRSGTSYSGVFAAGLFWFEIVRQVVEEVGADNFDGQAFYEKAIDFKMTLEGFEQTGFTESIRYAVKHQKFYEWSAAAGNVVAVSDWRPIIQ